MIVTIQALIGWAIASPTAVVAIQQTVFSAASGVFKALNWTKTAKFFGTLCTLDLGRVIDLIRTLRAAKAEKNGELTK